MASVNDREYMKTCAELAACLSISIASARRKVEIAAAKQGARDLKARKLIAVNLLNKAFSMKESGSELTASNLDNLLEALAEDENFMIED